MDLADRCHHTWKRTYPALPVLALASATLELPGRRSGDFTDAPRHLPAYADGSWQDASGQTYTAIAQDLWRSDSDQSIWTDIEPKHASSVEDGIVQVQNPNTPQRYTLYYDAATGGWQTLDGRSFTQNTDGTFSDAYGNQYPLS